MSEQKAMRLSQVARKLNVGRDTIVEFLADKGMEVDRNPNTKISPEQYTMLAKEYASSLLDKEEAESLHIGSSLREKLTLDDEAPAPPKPKTEDEEILITNLSTNKIEEEEETETPVEKLQAEEKEEPKTEAEPAEAKEEAKPAEEKEEAEEKPKKGLKV